jgi:hypothetical protein
MAETWASRELPVLKAIVDAFEEKPAGQVRFDELEKLTGLSSDDVGRALAKLYVASPPFFEGNSGWGSPYPFIISRITERALIATGQWPSPQSLVDQLVEALAAAAKDELDPVKKTKLQEAANLVKGVALPIAIAWVAGSLPHP